MPITTNIGQILIEMLLWKNRTVVRGNTRQPCKQQWRPEIECYFERKGQTYLRSK